jgi:radical SAM superfamily enzyme YgiQ (UPF0313 family)
MRILFIKHHSNRSDKFGNYPHTSDFYPPLGLVYIATVLKQNDQNDVIESLDSNALNLNLNQTISAIEEFNPDVIGITIITERIPGAMEIAEKCKEYFPDTLRIIGGPHMSVNPEEIMNLGLFQLGVIGEGEITILEIINEYKKSKIIPADIEGTIFYNNGNMIRNKPRRRIEDLDTIPFPDRHFLNNKLYHPYLAKKPWTYMTVSRGCPFKCAFCYQTVWGKKVTFNSYKRIFEEIKECVNEFGIREIWFKDDTFTLRKKNVLKLCDLMIKEKLKVRWTMFTRVDTVDEELVRALKKAGCYKIDFGVESGDQNILDLMKKGITIKQIRDTFEMCRRVGMQTHAFIMIGYPRETRETIEKTIRLTQEIADWASFNAVNIIKGTELYDLAVRENYYISKPMDFLSGQSERENYCNSPELPTSEILRLTSLAYKRFYLRPRHILRLLTIMIRDGNLLSFVTIILYALRKIFGKYQLFRRN